MPELSRLGEALTLVAATPKSLYDASGTTGFDVTGLDTVSVTLKNTGVTNPVNSAAVYWSTDVDGADFGAAEAVPLTGGSIAASGGVSVWLLPTRGARRMRITVTSTSGTTVTSDLHTQRLGMMPPTLVDGVATGDEAVSGADYTRSRSFSYAVVAAGGSPNTALDIAAGAYSLTCDTQCIAVVGSAPTAAALPGSQPAAGSENGAFVVEANAPTPLRVRAASMKISAIATSASTGTLRITGPIRG